MSYDLNGLLTSLGMPQTKEQKHAAYSKWYKSEKGQAYHKVWRERHRERIKEMRIIRDKTPEGRSKKSGSFKKWRSVNIESEKARWKEWYEKNKEGVRQRRAAKRDHAKLSAYSREYYARMKSDPIFQRKNRANSRIGSMKRRAVEKAVPVGNQKLIARFVSRIRASRSVKCYYCGKKTPGKTAHIDHVIPIAKGGAHDIGNLCAACPPCNRTKSAKMPREFAGLLSL